MLLFVWIYNIFILFCSMFPRNLYRLLAVVVHGGDAANSGHFITYRRGSLRNYHKYATLKLYLWILLISLFLDGITHRIILWRKFLLRKSWHPPLTCCFMIVVSLEIECLKPWIESSRNKSKFCLCCNLRKGMWNLKESCVDDAWYKFCRNLWNFFWDFSKALTIR